MKNIKRKLFFKRIIDPNTNCWIWTGTKSNSGYGIIAYKNKKIRVHRLSAMIWLDFDLKSKLFVCHHCDNPPCFNPNHLFIGTAQDNSIDYVRKGLSKTKLNESDILEMREMFFNNNISREELKKIFNVSYESICKIIMKKLWGHVEDEYEYKYEHHNKLKNITINMVIDLYNKGFSERQIAKQLNCSRGAVQNRLCKVKKMILI